MTNWKLYLTAIDFVSSSVGFFLFLCVFDCYFSSKKLHSLSNHLRNNKDRKQSRI